MDVVNLDEDDLEFILREGADSRTIKKLAQQAKATAASGDADEEAAQQRARQLHDKQTAEIKRALQQEDKEREERLECFLHSQHEELDKLLRRQGEHDPERVLEIKRKRQLIKMKAKAEMLTKVAQVPNWRRDLQR